MRIVINPIVHGLFQLAYYTGGGSILPASFAHNFGPRRGPKWSKPYNFLFSLRNDFFMVRKKFCPRDFKVPYRAPENKNFDENS